MMDQIIASCYFTQAFDCFINSIKLDNYAPNLNEDIEDYDNVSFNCEKRKKNKSDPNLHEIKKNKNKKYHVNAIRSTIIQLKSHLIRLKQNGNNILLKPKKKNQRIKNIIDDKKSVSMNHKDEKNLTISQLRDKLHERIKLLRQSKVQEKLLDDDGIQSNRGPELQFQHNMRRKKSEAMNSIKNGYIDQKLNHNQINDMDYGNLNFEKSKGLKSKIPSIGKPGSKAKRMKKSLKKLREIQHIGEMLPQEDRLKFSEALSMEKALLKAQGKPVHDNLPSLLKAEKNLKKKKIKSAKRWEKKKKEIEDKKKHNQANQRPGFEGRRQDFLNE